MSETQDSPLSPGHGRPHRLLPAVRLPRAVRQALVAHARREIPRECCGLLVGRGHTVLAAVPTMNLAPGEGRFHVNEREHLELRRALRLVSPPLDIVGVYHSHPGGAVRPSQRDVAEAFYPEWVYVVVGGASTRRVRAFEIRDGQVFPRRVSMSAGVAQAG